MKMFAKSVIAALVMVASTQVVAGGFGATSGRPDVQVNQTMALDADCNARADGEYVDFIRLQPGDCALVFTSATNVGDMTAYNVRVATPIPAGIDVLDVSGEGISTEMQPGERGSIIAHVIARPNFTWLVQ